MFFNSFSSSVVLYLAFHCSLIILRVAPLGCIEPWVRPASENNRPSGPSLAARTIFRLLKSFVWNRSSSRFSCQLTFKPPNSDLSKWLFLRKFFSSHYFDKIIQQTIIYLRFSEIISERSRRIENKIISRDFTKKISQKFKKKYIFW